MNLSLSSILFATFFLSYNSFSQDKNNLEKIGLNGRVKSINTVSYSTEIKSNKIKKGGLSKPSGAEVDRTLFFSSEGILVEEQQFDFSGKPFGTLVYQYDVNGNTISVVTTYTNGSRKERLDSNVYDQNDFLIEKYCSFKNNGDESFSHYALYEKYKYDIDGNILEEIRWRKDFMGFVQYNYEYNQNRHKIEATFGPEGDEIKMRVTYAYNSSGNMVEDNQYLSAEKLFCTNTYNYDDFENVTEMNAIHANGLKLIFAFHYIYDEQGNWIQKIEYWQGKPLYLIERKIIYYK